MQNTITPVAPTTATAPIESRPSPRSASPHAFATLLRQSQASAPFVAKAAPVPPARNDGAAEPSSQSGAGQPAANAAMATADARRRDDTSAASGADAAGRTDKRSDDIDAATDRDDKDKADSSAPLAATGTGLPPTHGLVALHRPTVDAHESGSSDKAGRAGRPAFASRGDAVGSGAATTLTTTSTDALASRGPADVARKDESSPLTRIAAAATDASSAKAAQAAPLVEAAKTSSLAPSELRADATLPAALSSSPTASPSATTAPTDVAVTTPLTSPDFAQAFAVQVSVLVQDGVQRAELHLNPTEMGPVSVQIVVDGTVARIDFGADALATRQAIEAGLPELASALRDAGMTLQGGGVSQHARDPDPDPKSGDASAASSGLWRNDDPRPAPIVRQRIVAAGGVDLYA